MMSAMKCSGMTSSLAQELNALGIQDAIIPQAATLDPHSFSMTVITGRRQTR